MPLNDPPDLAFERVYTNKFLGLGVSEGIPVHYAQDLAALDVGIHLTSDGAVTGSRVWFQLKGLHAATFPREDFDRAAHVAYSVPIDHLRAWYQESEAVYLVLYIESADVFLAEDVREIARRQWGDELLNAAMFKPDQVTATVKVSKAAQVNDAFWSRLRGHRSMRADGRMFRGRPLGHDYDPLRTTLARMEPTLFEQLVRDLLSEHGYRKMMEMDAECLFPGAPEDNLASLECGVLHEKFEIVLQATSEMIPTGTDGFRIEGHSDFAHGPCAVLIHSHVATSPNVPGLRALASELSQNRKITRLLAFVNSSLSTASLAALLPTSKGWAKANSSAGRNTWKTSRSIS